jgi:signal transduction histidine kinase
MRWPIQLQLLLPILVVVTMGIALSGLAGAHFGRRWAEQQEEEHLHRVVSALTDTVFPLNRSVLLKMRGLSGAEFVLLDGSDRPLEATLPIPHATLQVLRQLPSVRQWAQLAESPAVLLEGNSYRASRLPLTRRVSSVGAASLVVLHPEEHRFAATRQVVYPAALAGSVTALVAILVTTLLAQRFVRPIQRLRIQAAAIANGDFRTIELEPRNDEIRDLGQSINRLSERLGQFEAEVRRHERLHVLGQLGAGMAHQLRNAATGALMAIELHQRECAQGNDSETLDVAVRQVKLMESYLQRFVTLGRPETSDRKELRLSTLVEDTLALVRPSCDHAKIQVQYLQSDGKLSVEGDAENLRQVLMNLLINAIEAVRPCQDRVPKIVVDVRRQADRALISIQDNGDGPSPSVVARLFEPFVTGKPDGTGLGLWVASQIVAMHRGTISWQRDGGLTCFTIELPLLSLDGHGAPAGCG